MAYIARPRVAFAPVLRRQFEPAAALPCPTETLGRWRLGKQLHEGPLTTIHEARPATDDTAAADAADSGWPYVVKRLHTHWQEESRALDMLLREATVGSQIRHRHLVTVVDGNLEDPPYYIVLPRLPGKTLAASLASAGPIETPIALWVARQVAEALSALHDQGWLHGDVKPENIVVGPEGHATLIDLGFARLIGEPGSAADRWVAGTWNYIAPEMILSSGGFDARSDLYSLGATLYELLAGQPPFACRNLADLATAHRQSIPRPLDQLVPDLPGAAVELVHQLLAKEPLRRPSHAREVVRRLVALEIATLGNQIVAQ